MRRIGFIALLLATAGTQADLTQRLPEPVAVPPPAVTQQLEWSNSRPEQRQALDHFYRSLQSPQPDLSSQQLQRQQHIDQLRGMSPEQRQQQFLNFIQQQNAATLPPR